MKILNLVLIVITILLVKDNLVLYSKVERMTVLVGQATDILDRMDLENTACRENLNDKRVQHSACLSELESAKIDLSKITTGNSSNLWR